MGSSRTKVALADLARRVKAARAGSNSLSLWCTNSGYGLAVERDYPFDNWVFEGPDLLEVLHTALSVPEWRMPASAASDDELEQDLAAALALALRHSPQLRRAGAEITYVPNSSVDAAQPWEVSFDGIQAGTSGLTLTDALTASLEKMTG